MDQKASVIETLGVCGFLSGRFKKKVKSKLFSNTSSNNLGFIYRFALAARERLSYPLEVAIVKGFGRMGATGYAEVVLGMNERKFSTMFLTYYLWKQDLLFVLKENLPLLREMDQKYAYLYPESEVK